MNKTALNVLACPCCHSKLRLDETEQRLICDYEGLAYPIEQDIVVLLPESAQPITTVNEEDKVNA